MSYANDRMERLGLQRCPQCPKTSAVIGPDGPRDAACLFIGASPGQEDASRGRCFTGYHSQEFVKTYLPAAGLERANIRVTNMRKCFDPRDDDKLDDLNRACADFHLRNEILLQKPSVIIPMGAIAGGLMPDLNIQMQHGLPMENTNWYGHTCTTFPMRHPAESMHKSEAMIGLMRDFEALGLYLLGALDVPVDEYPQPLYEDLLDKNDVQFVLDTYGMDPYQWVAIDTETDPDEGFYCLSFSLAYGTGFMVRRGNKGGISALRDWVIDTYGTVVFHNMMFDVPVLQEVDFTVPFKRVDDTMLRSYHLQYTPQALKELGYRLCGVRMTDFEDLVLPFATDRMMEYILKVAGVDWPKPEPTTKFDTKTGELVPYKPQGLNTKIKRLITDFEKAPSHKKFDRWNEWSDDEKLPAIQRFGFIPKPSIKYVPKHLQVNYACADADVTGRVRQKLINMARAARRGN